MDATRLDVTLTVRNLPPSSAADAVSDLAPIAETMARNGLEVTLDVAGSYVPEPELERQ
jgi:hypothetical protein